MHQGLAQPLELGEPIPAPSVLLDPHAATPLSRADASEAATGIVAVDCSWNRFERRGGFSGLPTLKRASLRRLPFLLAGNAQHYGRLGELNTAEALAAAAYLLDTPERARAVLDGAGQGPSFLSLNAEALGEYRSARDGNQIRRAERGFF